MPLYEKTAGGLVVRKGNRRKSDGTLQAMSLPTTTAPTPTPAPGTYAPARVWDFQTANLSQWQNTHGVAPVIVDTPHPWWPKAARFTIDNNTRATFDDTTIRRSEVTSDGNGEQSGYPARGVRQFWGWTTWFPAGLIAPTANTVTGGWLCWTQWHHSGGGPVPFWFTITTGSNPPRLQLNTISGGHDLGAVPTGRADSIGNRVDVVLDVTWHDTPSLGRAVVKLNDVQVLDVACQNLVSDGATGTQAMYVKQGGYGNRYTSGTSPEPTVILHHAGLRRGTTLASITR